MVSYRLSLESKVIHFHQKVILFKSVLNCQRPAVDTKPSLKIALVRKLQMCTDVVVGHFIFFII